ncbi:tRNA preQ1(34) S-adenosylmethionine ribosyltransferase-isomerase QueA, partial [Pseudidiomarina aestuarii]
MNVSDFTFELPDELIARYPQPERSASRMLCLDGHTGTVTHSQFTAIVEQLQAG